MPQEPVLILGRGAVDHRPHPFTVDANGNMIVVATGPSGGDVWTISVENDVAVGNAKTFTVPAGHEWHALSVFAVLVTDANAGPRQVAVRVLNGAVVVDEPAVAGVTQIESLTRSYHFAPSAADLMAFRDTDWVMCPIQPTLILAAGEILQVLDRNAFAVGDTLQVYVRIADRVVS